MHRTTILLPDELYFKLRNLGWRTNSSVSLLLEVAALHALAPLLLESPVPESFTEWERRVRAVRDVRDKRYSWNRHKNGNSV